MSEQSRQRWLYVKNRLEELAWKYGPLDQPELPSGPDCDPSWGPVGSRLQRTDAALYEHVRRQHAELLRVERSQRIAEGPQKRENPPAPPQPSTESLAPRIRVARSRELPVTRLDDA